MDTKHGVFRQAKRFLSGTVLSRLTGLGRDVAMAYSFGAHPSVAAFMMALRFSHLLRRLFGEGALHTAFVPYFEEQRKSSASSAMRFYQGLSSLLFLITLLIVIVTELILLAFVVWGDLSQGNLEVVKLTMWLLPSFVFLAQTAAQMSFLQCMGSFFLPGLSPALVNIFWILGAVYLHGQESSQAMVTLSWAVSLGFIAQWLFLIPFSFKVTRSILRENPFPFSLSYFFKKIRSFMGYFGLGALGVGASQINSALDALFARSASLEGPAYLWYSIRIQQLPVGIFGIALAGALLPSLSRAYEKGDFVRYTEFLIGALKQSAAFILPASSALMFLGASIVTLIYQRGGFQAESVIETTRCLWGYTLGLPPMVFVLVLAPALYAKKQFRVPVTLAVVALILNTALNSLFVFGMGMSSLSVAISTSISAWVNAFYLAAHIRKNSAQFKLRLFKGVLIKLSLASLAGGIIAFFIGYLFLGDPTLAILSGHYLVDLGFMAHLKCFIGEAIVFLAIYLGCAYILKESETFSLWKFR